MGRPMKKTDKLEVRLSPEVKRAFLIRCQSAERSASETLRDLIEGNVTSTARPRPPPAVRISLACAALASLVFGAVCLASAGFCAIHPRFHLGLSIFLGVQGALYAAAGIAALRVAWRSLAVILATLSLVQLTYFAEITPPASIAGTVWGVLFGGMGPTIILAAASLAAWGLTLRNERLVLASHPLAAGSRR